MKNLFYRDKAIADLKDIWTHIAEGSGIIVADRFAQRIEDTVRRLVDGHTGSGRRRAEFGPDVRSFPVVPYLIFYSDCERQTVILRVLHGARDLKRPLMSLLIAAS